MQGVPLPHQTFLYNDYAIKKETVQLASFLRQEFLLHILLRWIYFMSCSKSFIFLRFSLLCLSRKFKIMFPWLFLELFKFHVFPMPLLYPGHMWAPSNITFKSVLFRDDFWRYWWTNLVHFLPQSNIYKYLFK